MTLNKAINNLPLLILFASIVTYYILPSKPYFSTILKKTSFFGIVIFSTGIMVVGFTKYYNDVQNMRELNKKTSVIFEGTGFQNSIQKAKKQKKMLFLDFYTSWCSACVHFNRTILMDKEVGKLMNESFINVKINAEHGEGIEISKRFKIGFYPTLLIVDSNENIVEYINREGIPNEDTMKAIALRYRSVNL